MTERNVYRKPEDRVLLRTADVYQTEAQDDVATYSDRLLSIVADFKNSGQPEGCNAQSMVGKSKRGEVACRLFARIDPATGIIQAAGFKARGCLAMTACASAACLLIQGKGLEEALELTTEDVREFVDGVPAGKVNALHFAVCAVRALVGDFLLRDGATLAQLDEAVPCDECSISCIMAEHCSLRQSRLELRMEEEAAARKLALDNALAAVFDQVRRDTAQGRITAQKEILALTPAHLMAGEFDEQVQAALDRDCEDGRTAYLSADSVRQKSAPQPAAKGTSEFANRGVGIPKIFGSKTAQAQQGSGDSEGEKPDSQEVASGNMEAPAPSVLAEVRTVFDYSAKALDDEEDFELVPPEGYKLVEVDGEWGLVATDEPPEPKKPVVDGSGIRKMQGKDTYYLYDGRRMKPNYAAWAFLAEEGDPLTTFAYCVREDSRIYPRPMAESDFANEPLAMGAEEVRDVWDRIRQLPDFQDLCRTQASNGDVYYYSSDYLSADHATSLAEWQSVDRFYNV